MTTLIDTETSPECVQALVSTWRYFKHDIEVSLTLLKKHREWVKHHKDFDGLSYQQTYDLIIHLEDLLDRGISLERKTYPDDVQKKKVSKTNTEPSSLDMEET